MKDYTGLHFGLWSVLQEIDRNGNHRRYICRCECGTERAVHLNNLVRGVSQNCGCIRRQKTGQLNLKHGYARPGQETPEFKVWKSMWGRCTNPALPEWVNYGGRGITISPRWREFPNFLADMGERPSPKHTLERRNTNGNYTAENCYWATRLEQANNTRANHHLTYQGRTLTIRQWEREMNLPVSIVQQRISKLGWSVERALTTPSARPIKRPIES